MEPPGTPANRSKRSSDARGKLKRLVNRIRRPQAKINRRAVASLENKFITRSIFKNKLQDGHGTSESLGGYKNSVGAARGAPKTLTPQAGTTD